MARSCGAKRIVKSKCTKHRNRGAKFRCPKIARGCGAKHICKSKCRKTHILVQILADSIRQNGMPLWREAHLQVKMHKTPQSRSNFRSSDVQKSHAAVARSTLSSQDVQNTTLSGHFSKFRCPKIARRCSAKHICKSKCGKANILVHILED